MGTINGVGTFYYRQGVRLEDETQVATLYFVVFFMPIIPLGCYRIRKQAITGASMQVDVVERLPLDLPQIALRYLMAWVGVPLVVFGPPALVMLAAILLQRSTERSADPAAWLVLFTAAWPIASGAWLLSRVRRA